MTGEILHDKSDDIGKLIGIVEGNAEVINEIYVAVMDLKKAVSIIARALADMNDNL